MTRPRIFLSHSSKDAAWCAQFVDALKAGGFDVWFDVKGLYVGDQWIDTLEKELEARDVFLIVLTPDSWSSEWVRKELRLALGRHKRILGVMHKRVQVSGFITTYQLLDATGRDAKQAAVDVVTALGGTAPVVSPPASAPRPTPARAPSRAPSADSHIVDISGMWEYQGNSWRAEWIFTQVGTAVTGVFKSGPAANGVWTSRPEFEASGSGQLVGRHMKLAMTYSKTRNSNDTEEEQMTVLGPDELESRSPSSTVVYRRVRMGR